MRFSVPASVVWKSLSRFDTHYKTWTMPRQNSAGCALRVGLLWIPSGWRSNWFGNGWHHTEPPSSALAMDPPSAGTPERLKKPARSMGGPWRALSAEEVSCALRAVEGQPDSPPSPELSTCARSWAMPDSKYSRARLLGDRRSGRNTGRTPLSREEDFHAESRLEHGDIGRKL